MKSSNYNSKSIQIMEGLEAVRKRPGMYIGSTDIRGLHHLVWEIIDNSIDEVLAGFGKNIKVSILKDKSIIIEDDGRGIPVDMHSSGVSAAEVIFTVLHAGGKFNSDVYKTSGGLHGVGASVTNALSRWLNVEIFRDKKSYLLQFENGGKVKKNIKMTGKTTKRGTKVHFLPDDEIFSTLDFNYTTIATAMKEKAYLMKGLEMTLIDYRIDKEEKFKFDDGIISFIKELTLNDKKHQEKPVFFSSEENDIDVEFAFQYTDSDHERIVSFVNNIRTHDGGTHETGFKNAFTKSINEFVKKHNLNKKTFTGDDIREGITAIISIKVPEKLLEFEGQTKSKLGTPVARNAVETVISTKLVQFLEQNRNIAVKLIQKMADAQKARDAAKKARDDAKNTKKKLSDGIALSGKLTPAQSKDYKNNELFLVEGDSAGGSAKQGRDRKHQAILPLKGKVVNAEKAKLIHLLKNEEIGTIINTIGAGIGKEFDIKRSKYGKIILMTDADNDGAHIQVLLLTFIYRFMQDLIKGGYIYIALPPLYKISKNKDMEYCYTEVELEIMKKKLGTGYQIQRYKGLGEMNADQLWETTMDPSKRTLVKVGIEDAILAEQRVSILMGENANIRREWINENINFTLEDNFSK